MCGTLCRDASWGKGAAPGCMSAAQCRGGGETAPALSSIAGHLLHTNPTGKPTTMGRIRTSKLVLKVVAFMK